MPAARPLVSPAESQHDHACAVGATQTVSPPEYDFMYRWVYGNPDLADRMDLLTQWLEDPTPREDIAAALGLPLGTLVRSFTETAPRSAPAGFRYRGIPFSVVAMAGICDDVCDDRFPRFGAPVTLRCYLADQTLLPQGMFEAADWNFMDAGRPGFLGYAYGVRHEDTLYLAGLQSDLGARYSYLFQGRGDDTEVRVGEGTQTLYPDELVARFGSFVPVLRRTFQRYWIQILLGAVCTWADAEPDLAEIGLLRYELEPDEQARGNVVHRVYRELPDKLDATVRCVRLSGRCYPYSVTSLARAHEFLGQRWQPDHQAIPLPPVRSRGMIRPA
jgi:hypothetical protein